MIIVWIDVGISWWLAVYDTVKNWFVRRETISFNKSKHSVFNRLQTVMRSFSRSWEMVISIARSFGRGTNTLVAHNKHYGVIELIAEMRDIMVIYASDATMRREVLWEGKWRRKDLVHERYKGINDDVSDAMLACEWYLKTTQWKDCDLPWSKS